MSTTSFSDHVRGGWAIRRGLFGASLLLLVTRCGGGSQPPEADESIGRTSAELVSSEWTSAVSMSVARQNHVAALLQNGSVLVAGGHPGNNTPTNTAEVYNPATGTWTTVGSMGTARRLFGACTLASGKVLVAGGNASAGDVTSAELFDPSANTWSATGSLAAAREDFSMTCLSDGRVLVAGGSGPSGLLSSAEVYSPTTGAWSSAGTLPAAIHTQGAVLLNDGRVLIAGGNNAAGPVKTAAIWSPGTNAWTATASMATARSFFALQILGDGRVLAAGGLVALPSTTTKAAEIYTPSTGVWSAAANLNTARYSGVSATLAAGPIVIGGVPAGPPLVTSESYDSVHNTWTQLVTTYGAVNQTATALTPTSLLVAGGNTGSSATTSAQIYGILNGFALYAQRSVTLGTSDHVNGGDVGVTSVAPSAFGPQLVVGPSTTVQTNHNLAAPSVSLGSGAHVGDVQTNSLTNSGATLGTQAPYPSSLPPTPIALPVGPGGSAVTVPAFTITTLNPGNYGALSVTGTVSLNAGNYTFTSVTMAAQAHLAGVSGTATVSVAGTFQAGNSVSISSPGATPAGQLVISVAGSDSGSTPAFSIGTGAAISAILSAPHGTLSIGASTTATGAFAAFDVKLGNSVTINYQNGFVGSAAQTGQQQLSGYITPAMAAAPLVGPVPGNTMVQLSVGLPLRNQTGLQNFIANLGDSTNSQYRQYLTPTTFASNYGPLPATSQALTGFLTASGLTVTGTYTSNQLVNVTGTAANIESAFFINLNFYQRPDGSQFYALDREPSLSLSASTAPILRIDGFDNFVVPQVAAGSGPIPAIPPEPTGFGLTGVNMYEGADFRKAYVPYTSLTGAHQTVALVEFDGFFPADITAYENLPAYKTLTTSPPPVTPVLLNGFNGQPSSQGDYGEVTLDIDMVLAMAPGLDNIFVYEMPTPTDLLSPAGLASYSAEAAQELNQIGNPTGTTPLSRQISCSWFLFGGPNVAAALQQFAADGQSFLFAAGDTGAFGSSNPPQPPVSEAESAFMTVVGGTQLTTNASQQWSSETTWNDALKSRGYFALGTNNTGSGGVMTGIPIPWYQSPIAAQITKAGGSATTRAVPDVSLTATDIGVILSSGPGCSPPLCNGEVQFTGGTSAAAPLWAGIIALVNEQSMTFNGGGALGFANPAIYRVAQGPNYGSEFHDISDKSTNGFTSGSPFLAIGGYDLATGWGTPGGSASFNLINDLAGSVPNVYTSVSAGGQFACGVTTSNEAECWGLDTSGQLGNNASGGSSDTPQQVIFGTGSPPNVGQLSAGDAFACAVSAFPGEGFGLLYCWGDNTDGECGVSAAAGTIQAEPVLVGGTGVVPGPEPGLSGVSAGSHFACAIDTESQAWCWGDDAHGELGPGATGTTPTPTNVGLIGVNQVSAGNGFACAVVEAETSPGVENAVVQCWGDNSSGQLGNGMIGAGGPTPVTVLLPYLGANGLEVQSVAAANGFACADVTTLSGNQVWCWGNDSVGQLGDGGQGSINPTPVQAVNLVDPFGLTAGGQTACAITFNSASGGSGGNVQCWGSNSNGQLGTGSNSPASTGTPQQVVGLTAGLTVSMGSNSGCALGMAASVPVCWGANGSGQLGDNSTTGSNLPVPIE